MDTTIPMRCKVKEGNSEGVYTQIILALISHFESTLRVEQSVQPDSPPTTGSNRFLMGRYRCYSVLHNCAVAHLVQSLRTLLWIVLRYDIKTKSGG